MGRRETKLASRRLSAVRSFELKSPHLLGLSGTSTGHRESCRGS
jgi:hypothetical protein